jgi:hypothetical protein
MGLKDVLELFCLEKRHSFQRFFEFLLVQSGGIFEATRFATPCEVSRTTPITAKTHLRPLCRGVLRYILRHPIYREATS